MYLRHRARRGCLLLTSLVNVIPKTIGWVGREEIKGKCNHKNKKEFKLSIADVMLLYIGKKKFKFYQNWKKNPIKLQDIKLSMKKKKTVTVMLEKKDKYVPLQISIWNKTSRNGFNSDRVKTPWELQK